MKSRFRPLFEWLIRQKTMYARGRSWSDFIGVAISAGAFARYGLSNPLAWSILAGIILSLTMLGHIEKRLGTWDYELDFMARLSPYNKRIEARLEELKKAIEEIKKAIEEIHNA